MRSTSTSATSGTGGLAKVVRGLVIEIFNLWQSFLKRQLPKAPLIAGGRPYPFVSGKLEKGKAPTAKLDLRPGDLVRVKSKEEIEATLDHTNHNRGLSFDGEMVRYCGRTARVRARVNRLVDEHTGRDDRDQVRLHHPRRRRLRRRLPPVLSRAPSIRTGARSGSRESSRRISTATHRHAPGRARSVRSPRAPPPDDPADPERAGGRRRHAGLPPASVHRPRRSTRCWRRRTRTGGWWSPRTAPAAARSRPRYASSPTIPGSSYTATGENLGAAANWTRLIQQATRPYVTLLQDDDVWDPEFLARRVAFLERHRSCAFVFSGERKIDHDGREIAIERMPSLPAKDVSEVLPEGVYAAAGADRRRSTGTSLAGSTRPRSPASA